MYRRAGSIFLMVLGALTTWGQVSNSPLTQYGVGDLYGAHQAASYGMGGIGISAGDIRYINNQNPALLVYNSIYTYTAGVLGESRTTSAGASQKSGGMNLSYLGMSFPIKTNKWVSSVMLTPYSNVNYQFITEGNKIGGATYTTTLAGKQGLAQLEWAHGIRLHKNITIGAKAKYLFGSIRKASSNRLTSAGTNTINVPTIFDRDAVSDILFEFGAQYRYEMKENTYANFGLTYDLGADANTRRLRTLEIRNVTGVTTSADTLIDNTRGKMTMPSSVGFGASVGQPLKWLAGVDVKLQQWKNFRDYDGNSGGLQNTFSVAVGGEYTPDAGSVSNFFKRVTYRVGGSYEQTPYVVNGSGVNDLGINFGASLPVSGISSLDMGFRFGKRGSSSSNGISEDYFRLQIGMTFNDRLWFIKRKFD